MDSGLEALVREAKSGDREALEQIIERITDRIYGLALRMLYHPEDAEDATQEILIKVITHLSAFREESAFTTWVYRIASNHLIRARCRRPEYPRVDFEYYAEKVARKSAMVWREMEAEAPQGLIVEEIRISCLQAMLLCLGREHRLAYILGEIFDVTSEQGGRILDISPEAFRKRLSRARAGIRDFMGRHCNLVKSTNPCRCERVAAHRIKTGQMDRNQLEFASHSSRARRDPDLLDQLKEMDELNRIAALFKRDPDLYAPEGMVDGIKQLLRSGEYDIIY